MRVVFQSETPNSQAVVLADDGLYSEDTELTVIDGLPEHTQAVQLDALTESDAPFIAARGNAQVTYSLTVLARFETPDERRRYHDTLMAKLLGRGEVVINYDGGFKSTLRTAVCTAIRVADSTGTSCVLNLVFVGSALN